MARKKSTASIKANPTRKREKGGALGVKRAKSHTDRITDRIRIAKARKPNRPTAGDLSALDHALSDFYCELVVVSHAVGSAEDTGDTELLSHAAASLRHLVERMESLRTTGDILATRAGHAEIHAAGGAT